MGNWCLQSLHKMVDALCNKGRWLVVIFLITGNTIFLSMMFLRVGPCGLFLFLDCVLGADRTASGDRSSRWNTRTQSYLLRRRVSTGVPKVSDRQMLLHSLHQLDGRPFGFFCGLHFSLWLLLEVAEGAKVSRDNTLSIQDMTVGFWPHPWRIHFVLCQGLRNDLLEVLRVVKLSKRNMMRSMRTVRLELSRSRNCDIVLRCFRKIVGWG